jgi:hypothetical protein
MGVVAAWVAGSPSYPVCRAMVSGFIVILLELGWAASTGA